jgi:hypothetical protein
VRTVDRKTSADGARVAAEAAQPLIRFLKGVRKGVDLIDRQTMSDFRDAMLSQLVRDLRLAARVLDQLDSSVEEARTLFEDTVDRARKAARGRLKLTTKQPPGKRWQGTAAHSLDDLRAGRASSPPEPAVLPPRRKRPTLDSLATEVAETLDRLGGSASLTELLRKGRGMSGSQVKRGLVALEEAGEIYRTGSRRSTRYHRFKKDDCIGAPWEVPAQ